MSTNIADEKKEKVIEEFCIHLEEGRCEYSFVEFDFRKIEEFAVELDRKRKSDEMVEKIKKALRKSFAHWENMLFEMYKNDEKKYFFPIWIFYAKSRFGFGATEYKPKKGSREIIKIDLSLDKDSKKISGKR
ncbi:MAG: hypothetical protein HY959_08670 [Ignavibacteriae bacterium]|nr:hypothetical protein [Ignavibacteriota bacterium]